MLASHQMCLNMHKDTKLIKDQINTETADQRKNYWQTIDLMHVYTHGSVSHNQAALG